MTDKILAKINTEYELFFMQMMSCTKELLYSRSREIEMKKTITSFLRNEVKNNKDIKLIRMSTSINLLDEFCRQARTRTVPATDFRIGHWRQYGTYDSLSLIAL